VLVQIQPPKSKKTDTGFKHMIAGSLAGMASKTILQPLDLVKVRLQVQDGTGKNEYKGEIRSTETAPSKGARQRGGAEGHWRLAEQLLQSLVCMPPDSLAQLPDFPRVCCSHRSTRSHRQLD